MGLMYCAPLQRHPVPEVILFQVGSNYFLLTAEIKFETRVMSFERHDCGLWECIVVSQIETAFKFKKTLTS